MSKLARDHRNRDLAIIHIAKKQLGLSEEDYRAMLQGYGCASSSAKLDPYAEKLVEAIKSWKQRRNLKHVYTIFQIFC